MKKISYFSLILTLAALAMTFSSFAAAKNKSTASEEAAQEIVGQYKELDYLFDWEYSKMFKSDRQKAFKLLKELDEKAKKGGALLVREMDFLVPLKNESKTLSETIKDDIFMLYYGEMKNNRPDGMGILLDDGLNSQVYVGYFNKGKPTKYGMKFDYYGAPMWECDEPVFDGKDFKADGSGILYYCIESDVKGVSDEGLTRSNHLKNISEDSEKTISFEYFDRETAGTLQRLLKTNRVILHPLVFYEGELSDNAPSGKGKMYYDTFNEWIGEQSVETSYDVVKGAYGPIYFDGKMGFGGATGKCKVYYPDGQLQYEGEYKNGKRNGKGTLYNPDGSVNHKGKFKNGDIG